MNKENDVETVTETDKPKKRKSFGRIKDAAKRLRAQSFELGENCLCRRFRCFQVINEREQQRILGNFNEIGATSLEPWNAQASYLSGLISVMPVSRRRSRSQNAADAKSHDCSFSYRVRLLSDTGTKDIQVCKKAFIALHGITRRRLETIQRCMKEYGVSPKDNRGKHNNRPRKLKKIQIDAVLGHIKSFRGRFSHYSGDKTKKLYLPAELNVQKMYAMFKDQCKAANNVNLVSYESYRTIFNTRFNVAFGYPRKDTCSTCDAHAVKCKDLENVIKSSSGEEKITAERSLRRAELLHDLHLRKAVTFYKRKTASVKVSKDNNTVATICMDYQRNLNLPNITTNDAYYRRKLGFYMFNIHELANSESLFYCYSEEIGSKGSNEVISFLDHYIMQCLNENVRTLNIFCDSCGGQNKNKNLLRYCHLLVFIRKRLDEVLITFPIRGHSYMESDRNMAIIKTKSRAESPQDWIEIVNSSRQNPRPFKTIEVDQPLIRNWSLFFQDIFLDKCPFPTRPIKEFKVMRDFPGKVMYRDTYNGVWIKASLIPPDTSDQNMDGNNLQLGPNEFLLPPQAYKTLIPIPEAKYKDVIHLSKFCIDQKAREFYFNLPHGERKKVNKKNRPTNKK